MKYGKKMMLVDIPNDDISTHTESLHFSNSNYVDPVKYLKVNTLYELGSELDDILKRIDLNDRERWLLYNQTLRRFLFHLNV